MPIKVAGIQEGRNQKHAVSWDRLGLEGLRRRITYIVPALIPDSPFANQILEGSVSIVDCCVSGRDQPDWSLQGGWFEARDDSLVSSSSTTEEV